MRAAVYFGMVFSIVILSGCQKTVDDLRIQNQQNLRSIEVGMSKLQVMKIMGDACVKTFYDTGLGRPSLPPACNPYKVEITTVGDQAYEVLFYVMEKKYDDGAITDDELLPLYFQDDILKGYGYSFIQSQRKSNPHNGAGFVPLS